MIIPVPQPGSPLWCLFDTETKRQVSEWMTLEKLRGEADRMERNGGES